MKKELKEYLSSQFDSNTNYESIIKKVEGSGIMSKKKILSVAAILVVVLILGIMTPSIYAKIRWEIEYKEYQNRKINYGLGSINTTVEENESNIDMEYVYQDGIGAKVESLIITNDYFKMGIDFSFSKEIEINTDTFSYDFAVYDENNNIYGIFEGIKIGEQKEQFPYFKKLYQELGVKYNKNNIYETEYQDSCQGATVTTSERGHIIASSTMTSSKGFPKSQKLYIRIFHIRYGLYNYDKEARRMIDAENVSLSDAEWILEVEVPEEFYNRETIELKINENIDGFELTKAEVTETGMSMKVKLDGIIDIIFAGKDQEVKEFDDIINNSIHIEDETGKIYSKFGLGTTENANEIKIKYDISKRDINKHQYYLCLNVKGESHKVKLDIK